MVDYFIQLSVFHLTVGMFTGSLSFATKCIPQNVANFAVFIIIIFYDLFLEIIFWVCFTSFMLRKVLNIKQPVK